MEKNSSTALMIVNYGTPNSTKRGDVRRFLRQLLNSKHVININPVGRNILVNCIIAPFRTCHSTQLYRNLQEKYGSPLKTYTDEFAQKLQRRVGARADVYVAMTAGYSLVSDVLDDILSKRYDRLIVAPMFPQYTESTWGKALDDVYSYFRGKYNIPVISTIQPFFNHPGYLDAIVSTINSSLEDFEYERLVFSYHGVPLSHLRIAHGGGSCDDFGCKDSYNSNNSHCYCAQCYESTRLIASRLGLSDDICATTFQSRMSDRWLQPYTDEYVTNLARQGVRKVAIVTPAFTVDCLETLVEIGEELRDSFLSNGGTDFRLVPCLNASSLWVAEFEKMALG